MRDLVPAWKDGRLQPIDKMQVHREGLRHKAISVFVTEGDATLIQRRADTKYHTPGHWANACCTHPFWGESAEDCAHRRLREELGIAVPVLQHRGQVTYRADVGGGLTEHEVVEIFTAPLPARIEARPDPAEVGATRWVSWGDLDREIAETPERFVPWLRIYLARHRDLIAV
ncbi:isopentenyl-diphosphate Delta-isomerase [Wenxinia saemankumensis]|uniref:Isopentenyl-diphosphate Delta-isomerase n=1 Tax=Wenxinia saemankumensis TaxID=1447782 RepID=A0A1M6B0F9_9RHOB|nr:isopentenyl-diphosphate Delta-isomerase [Wenxinia saemankumensis]SHI42244.1 isopentenyl-diphosphate delta-isomerase [Wenxinia saemankumensis]